MKENISLFLICNEDCVEEIFYINLILLNGQDCVDSKLNLHT
jgi:hypothetical protein